MAHINGVDVVEVILFSARLLVVFFVQVLPAKCWWEGVAVADGGWSSRGHEIQDTMRWLP